MTLLHEAAFVDLARATSLLADALSVRPDSLSDEQVDQLQQANDAVSCVLDEVNAACFAPDADASDEELDELLDDERIAELTQEGAA